jgi:hypothetical protein
LEKASHRLTAPIITGASNCSLMTIDFNLVVNPNGWSNKLSNPASQF